MKKYIFIILFILSLIFFRNIVDSKNYIFSPLEIDKTLTRQEYLGDGLGKIYKNRFGVAYFNKIYPIMTKFESNFFADLGDGIVFIPLIGALIYLGYKKYNEK